MFPKAVRSRLSVSLFINRRGDLVAFEGRPWKRQDDQKHTVPGSDDISLEFLFGDFTTIKFVVVTKRGISGQPGTWEHADLILRGEISAEGVGTLTGPGGIKIECQGFDPEPIRAIKDGKGVKAGDIIGHRLIVAALPSPEVIRAQAQPRQAKINYTTPTQAPKEVPALTTGEPEGADDEGTDDDIPF